MTDTDRAEVVAIIEDGIRQGRIHPADSAEGLDTRDAEAALDRGDLGRALSLVAFALPDSRERWARAALTAAKGE